MPGFQRRVNAGAGTLQRREMPFGWPPCSPPPPRDNMTVCPRRVSRAPPPPEPPAPVSTTAPRLRFRSSTSSHVRRYGIRRARPAPEMEPACSIASSTATLPGPIRTSEAKSIRILSRSTASALAFSLLRRTPIARKPITRSSQDQRRSARQRAARTQGMGFTTDRVRRPSSRHRPGTPRRSRSWRGRSTGTPPFPRSPRAFRHAPSASLPRSARRGSAGWWRSYGCG